VISIALDDTSPGAVLTNILAASIVAHVATSSHGPRHMSLRPLDGVARRVTRRGVGSWLGESQHGLRPGPSLIGTPHRIAGRGRPPHLACPMPRSPPCIDRLPGRLRSRGLHSRDRLTHSRIAANCCLVNCDSDGSFDNPLFLYAPPRWKIGGRRPCTPAGNGIEQRDVFFWPMSVTLSP
jgi:hypothetical protein